MVTLNEVVQQLGSQTLDGRLKWEAHDWDQYGEPNMWEARARTCAFRMVRPQFRSPWTLQIAFEHPRRVLWLGDSSRFLAPLVDIIRKSSPLTVVTTDMALQMAMDALTLPHDPHNRMTVVDTFRN